MNIKMYLTIISRYEFPFQICKILKPKTIDLHEMLTLTMDTKRKYTIRERIDPFIYYDHSEFERRFRMSKNLVRKLFDEIDGSITLDPKVVREGFTIPGITKLLIGLRFYAVGTFSEALGDIFGVSKSTVCVTVSEVSYIIGPKLRDRYINMPNDEESILQAKAKFHRFQELPLMIGAVDGTHIRIQSLGGAEGEYFRNRKTYFSINCQMVVSADVSKKIIKLHSVEFEII